MNVLEQAQTHLNTGLNLARRVEDLAVQANALAGLALLETRRLAQGPEHLTALALYHNQAVALFEALGHKRDQAVTLLNMASAQWSIKRYDDALNNYSRARDLAESSGDLGTVGVVWNNMAAIHAQRSQHQHARQCYQQALDIYASIDIDPYIQSVVHHNMGNCELHCCVYDEALVCYDRSIQLLERARIPESYLMNTKNSLSGQAMVHACLGQFREARTRLDKARTLLDHEENPWPLSIIKVLCSTAYVAALQGDLQASIQALDHLDTIRDERGFELKRYASVALRLRTHSHRCRGELNRAEACCREALEVQAQSGVFGSEEQLTLELGRILLDQERFQEAAVTLDNALGELELQRDQYHDVRAICLLHIARYHRLTGRLGMARHCANEALTIMNTVGHRTGQALVQCELAWLATHTKAPKDELDRLDVTLKGLALHPDSEILQEREALAHAWSLLA
ncbi:MAG: tetratricopeptide repeat protein [Myxococcota bacterium]